LEGKSSPETMDFTTKKKNRISKRGVRKVEIPGKKTNFGLDMVVRIQTE